MIEQETQFKRLRNEYVEMIFTPTRSNYTEKKHDVYIGKYFLYKIWKDLRKQCFSKAKMALTVNSLFRDSRVALIWYSRAFRRRVILTIWKRGTG